MGSGSSVVVSPTETIPYPLPKITKKPTKVLECDKKTPDAHIPRDSRLIRLTGIHPFNCEAPLNALYDGGFLTPSELWFVRNHGYVPEVLDPEILQWEFSIEGMVENPMRLTFSKLLTLNQVTIPVTIACAGNRRKEQNIVRKGNGFNWGSAAVSTALFTGVPINELLKRAKPKRGARHLCMEGADKLPNGYYGTSIPLSIAMNPAMGVMVAHKMNGEPLTPDHGRPLRVVVPGQIGARSVKWLKRLIITETPSDNWYHLYDNRVLPTMLTPEMAAEDKSWYQDERYALSNLNVQSVICYPAHDEVLKVKKNNVYTVRGYSYSGGGVRIGRVEISLDQGCTWKLTNIDYPEDRYREAKDCPKLFGGKLDMSQTEHCYCWCFWNIEISIMELSHAKDIVVRAMDGNMNIQPRDMYWNVLSMLNNCWYRVTITHLQDSDKLKFDHPIVPALTNGGWMEKVKAEGGNLLDGFWGSSVVPIVRSGEKSSPTIKMTNNTVTRIITKKELSKHNKDGDAWFVVNGHVYDASDYLSEHPGGRESIILASGADASEDFIAIHSDNAKAMLAKYHIGVLETNPNKSNDTINKKIINTPRNIFLQQKQWNSATLKKKTIINHDSVHLTFALEHPNQTLGVPTGKHIFVRCVSPSGEKVIRSYTPISETNKRGEFDLVVKIYRASNDRPAGKMSACIDLLKEGDTIDCKGPFGDIEYQGNGVFLIKGVSCKIKKLTMIAGGSGITPIYQIFRNAYKDGIHCDVTYCNKTEEDILLRKELEKLSRLRHRLSRPTNGWTGRSGYVSQRDVGLAHDGLLLCCGPPEMMDAVYKIAQSTEWNVHEQFIRF